MAEMTKDMNLNQVAILLSRYQFEMKGHDLEGLIDQWLPLYPVRWIRLAVVEALYQGRYKVISVEHILRLWLRRGHPTFHFNHEFERMICNNMLGSMTTNPSEVAKRHLTQTALPSFYQMEQSTNFSSLSSPETAQPSEIAIEETSLSLVNEGPARESTDVEDDFDTLFIEDEPTLIENPQLESATGKLTDVKELFAQLISQNHIADSTKVNAEQDSMSGHSIHEFTPHSDHSVLYSKMKSVLQQSL